MENYPALYKNELLSNVVPFWDAHGIDLESGGFFSCLDRAGNVYDTDKFIWLQCRGVWMYSTLHHTVERNPEWIKSAEHGATFLEKYGRDEKGNWYFSLNRQGRPLTQPYSLYSDCYAAMAFAALYKCTGEDVHAEIVQQTFANILARRNNPKGIYNKAYPGTRPLKTFSMAMILCNLALEAEHLLGKQTVDSLIDDIIFEVMDVFYKKESGLVYENVMQDGSLSDSFEGRLLSPGHSLEAMWFIMDLGMRRNDRNLVAKAAFIAHAVLDYGWDKMYGGIFYSLDSRGCPPQQLEWDQKLWWVHVEALVCMAKAFKYTGSLTAKDWFRKLHDYTWLHFRDKEFPEWFGYLDRKGEVLLSLKGGKWKGFFHIPRALLQIFKTLE